MRLLPVRVGGGRVAPLDFVLEFEAAEGGGFLMTPVNVRPSVRSVIWLTRSLKSTNSNSAWGRDLGFRAPSLDRDGRLRAH